MNKGTKDALEKVGYVLLGALIAEGSIRIWKYFSKKKEPTQAKEETKAS